VPQIARTASERVRLELPLINLLLESLFDDTKGNVNIAREKEIKKLANKLKNSAE
jgi:hypothetical protein